MSIPTLSNKIKGVRGEGRKLLIFIGILVAVAALSFYLGYAARAESHMSPPVVIQCPANAYMDPLALAGEAGSGKTGDRGMSQASPATGPYVASKSGTKYYPVACSGAKRIKDENKVYFMSEVAAQSAGLALAAGCK